MDEDTLNLLELITFSYRIQYSQSKQLRLHDALCIDVFLPLINLLQQQSDELRDTVGLYSEELGGVIVFIDFSCDM